MTVVLDANAIIMHGRSFPDRVRATVDSGTTIVLPRSVKRELVDDVLENDAAPENHRESARDIRRLIDDGTLLVQSPNFERYGSVIDESRRRIADDSLPEHDVKADQYIPALVCELARDERVRLVTGDRKLRRVVRDVVERQNVADRVEVCDPLTVL